MITSSYMKCELTHGSFSKLHAFIGDPNFPSRLSLMNRDEIVCYYEHLYRHFSSLLFSSYEDRPAVFAPLKRLICREIGIKGGYGIFDDGQSILLRTLLWRRASAQTKLENLESAFHGMETFLPAWTWLAYYGTIDYFELPVEGM
ncbi:hypothetical protein QBC38DRAFT_38105 [Podospora fimiseda]|uniref:Uncharacterized protein n=1 Tax=Podospora fimiseda TaxID=252190 RepID=A0AAN7BHY0_9PEZI|nr:hypothetical protein QBC38DRAFT_38105 [Podospora fimiseda]